jgi:ABC-type uncharacterized transport system permease subunit
VLRIRKIAVVAVCAFAALAGVLAATAGTVDHRATQHEVAGGMPPGFGWD